MAFLQFANDAAHAMVRRDALGDVTISVSRDFEVKLLGQLIIFGSAVTLRSIRRETGSSMLAGCRLTRRLFGDAP